MKFSNNIFWKKATNYSNDYTNNSVKADSLEDATKLVMHSDDARFAFRRNKELFDFKGKFKSFAFRNKNYIIKTFNNNAIPQEYINAKRAKQLLKNIDSYYIPIPKLIVSDNKIALLYPDYGYTLHENVDTLPQIPLDKIMYCFKDLLSHGIEWAGFLPRNIIKEKNRLIFIDWEDVTFNNHPKISISDLTFFKMILGWSQIYGSTEQIKEVIKKNNITIYTTSPDNFEFTYGNLTNTKDIKKIKQKATLITLDSESHSLHNTTTDLSFMDIGHIIDDLFSTNISVLYTCCSATIRKTHGDLYFSTFADAFENVLCFVLRDNDNGTIIYPLPEIQKTILLFLLYFFQEPSITKLNVIKELNNIIELNDFFERESCISSYILKFISYEEIGITNAISRSSCMHNFLFELFEIIKTFLAYDKPIFLLLRGSCAHGLMTINSDVDFEVSNWDFPYGHSALELLISDILNIFDVKNEGSCGRPQEVDVFINGYTRDYHEWTELTCPNNIIRNKGWLNNQTPIGFSEQKWSEYEKKNKYISEKYLFFKARTLVMRLAIKNNISCTFFSEQLSELENYINPKIIEKIKKVIEETLYLYETNKNDIKRIWELNEQIDNLYIITNLKMCI